MDVTSARDECEAVLNEVEEAVITDREFLETVLVGFLSDGHVLLEDVPGTGKTLTARSVATALGLEFSRIQFTPDLLPADVLGTHVFNEKTREFEFQPGPVFANVVLADEINRAPPKTQAALLEAMEEGQATIDGETMDLPKPFFVIATQNPVEQEGSLHPDETVYANGRLWRAGDLLDNAKSNGECIVDTGTTQVYDIDATTQTLTPDGEMRRQSCLVYEAAYEGDVYTVETKTGRRIRVSGNHPFLVNREGRLQWVHAEELRSDDALVAPERLHVEPTPFPPHDEVVAELADEFTVVRQETVENLQAKLTTGAQLSPTEWDRVRIASGDSKKDLADLVDVSYDRVLRYFEGTENGVGDALERNVSPEDLVSGDHFESHDRTSLRRPPTDAEAGFLVGFVLSDGWATDASIEVAQKNHPESFDRWVSLCRTLGLDVRIRTHKGVRHAKVYSKPFVRYLEERYSLDDPSTLVDAPESFAREFLDIFMLAESHFDSKSGRVTFTQKDTETTNLIAYLLERFGIRPWLYDRDEKQVIRVQGEDLDTYVSEFTWPGEEPEVADGSVHRSTPVNAEMLRAFTDALGLQYAGNMADRDWYQGYRHVQQGRPRVQESSLAELVADGGAILDERESVDPLAYASEDIKSAAHDCGLSITDVVAATDHTKHRIWQAYTGNEDPPETAREFVAESFESRRENAGAVREYLEKLVESDAFCDPVTNIESEHYEGSVVGLSVPETHNYVAGYGACGINHNTFPLPEAQMDRFVAKAGIGYPDEHGELDLLRRRAGRDTRSPTVDSVLDEERVQAVKSVPEDVRVEGDLLQYMVSVARATREDRRVEVGVSPRGTQRLFESARARAVVHGREYVVPEDVKRLAPNVLAHRIVLTPDAAVENVEKRDVVDSVLDEVAVPTVER